MKNLKLFYIVLPLLCLHTSNWAQLIKLPVFDDPGLNTEKEALVVEIGVVYFQKKAIEDAYNNLIIEEKKFQEKLKGGKASIATSSAATKLAIEEVKTLSGNIQDKIILLQATPPFQYPFIKAIQSELDVEEEYFKEVNNNFQDASVLDPTLGGGAGYGKNYFVQIFLRCKRILSKLHELDYRINNLDVFRQVVRP